MKKLYTAVGRFERRGKIGGMSCPIVVINQKEYAMDLQEMLLWTVLNWRILDADDLGELYRVKECESGFLSHRTMTDCLHRLLQRGLAAEGSGETGEEALYRLLANLYVVPVSENLPLRVLSFVRLTVFHGVPFAATKKLFLPDKRTDEENKVLLLSRQALLSTAELIKCMELQVAMLPTEQSLMDTLYADAYTTSDNIADMVRGCKSCRTVLISVANLCLRRQIIFERI
ncbi:MAG: hypothetical protein PHY23_00250 [Oscillospiraceae bacterium]|nr:hypothetical protein [Oscillospiraceae bacterium]